MLNLFRVCVHVCVILCICPLYVCMLVLCLGTIFCMSCAVRSSSSKRACLCLGWRSLGAHAPVPPILQTTVDPSSDKASLCAGLPRLCRRSPRVEICVRVFFYFGPSGGKPYVTAPRTLPFWKQRPWQSLAFSWYGSSHVEPRWQRRGVEKNLPLKWKHWEDRGYHYSSGLFICYWQFILVSQYRSVSSSLFYFL